MTDDPYKYFRLEAAELLDELSRAALSLEKTGDDPTLAKALRHAHTLKGAARVVRLPGIGNLAHAIEDVLEPYRNRASALSATDARKLFDLLDQVTRGVRDLDRAPVQPKAAKPTDETVRGVRAELAQLDSLLDAATEASSALRSTIQIAHELEGVTQLDQVTSRVRALLAGLQTTAREIAEVMEAADQLRLVRIDAMEVALQRTARDAAETLGRTVEVALTGGDIRVEADLLSALQDALVQLVRNAVAHGIEAPAQRQRAGKPAAGRITIEAVRSNRGIVVRCIDDGGGVDADALRRASGNATAGLLELLVQGGLSTASRVTPVAGRGIGLELVADIARRLGGELAVDSKRGAGTTFTLALPSSLSSLEVLGAECAGTRVGFPLRAVSVVRRLRDADIVRSGPRETVIHGDATIPLLRLSTLLPKAVATSGPPTAVILATAGGSIAVAIDRVLEVAPVIVRPIPACAGVEPFVSGVSADAEGRAQLILDADQLAIRAASATVPAERPARTRHPVLIVDDSMPTRMLEQSILEAAGYVVDTAVSAEEALEIVRTKRYSLFLVDVEMPGMDGFSFIERIRADAALRETPAIMISSRADAADFLRAREVGAQGYIVKSEFDQISLLSQISALLGERHG